MADDAEGAGRPGGDALSTSGEPSEQRSSELVAALAAVRTRIADACAEAGRDQREVTLVAVTKTRPASDVVALCRLGVRDVGESRDQEAVAKVADVTAALNARNALPAPSAGVGPAGGAGDESGAPETPAPRWHFVGRVQSRKARSIAGYAACVHSVDRAVVVTKLAAACRELGRDPLPVFVQLSLDGDPDRGGVVAENLLGLAGVIADLSELRLAGVMAVAPMGVEPDRAFAALAEQAHRLRAEHPAAQAISAGMSTDLQAAVRHGATHVRVGSALLGRRGPVFG